LPITTPLRNTRQAAPSGAVLIRMCWVFSPTTEAQPASANVAAAAAATLLGKRLKS
jgi:hypothetical protein